MKEEQFYTTSVNSNWILFDYLTCDYFSNIFILHIKWLMRPRKPKMTVQVKLAKLASIPPRWDKHAPNQPKWPQIDAWTWLK